LLNLQSNSVLIPLHVRSTVRFFKLVCILVILPLLLSSCSNDVDQDDLSAGMKLVLSDSAFAVIKNKRDQALERGLLVKTDNDYVPGFIECNGKRMAVKARLKGDHTDHLKGERWSFRIVSKGNTILNHEKISIQGVHTRSYLNEWVFHELLKQEGLISLQYTFLPFCVGDSLCGIYALESHFDNFLLKRAKRKMGPIMKFDEDDFWDAKKFSGKNKDELYMRNAQIGLYNKKWCKKKSNVPVTKKAIAQLDDFRQGKLPAADVFDLEKWAKFIAVNELMSIDHALRWHNLRFYFNPETEKIEPIGFDCGSWLPKGKELFFTQDNVELFHRQMLQDASYNEMIVQELTRLTTKEYLVSFFDDHQSEIKEMELMMQSENAKYKFWKSSYYNSQKRILGFLDNTYSK